MNDIKIKFDTKKLERNLNKQINKSLNGSVNRKLKAEQEKMEIRKIVESKGNGMKILNDTEKELLRLILSSEHTNYTYSGNVNVFPEYITIQIKKLFAILEECGYAAKTYCWIGGEWQVTLTPLGVSYFEKEEEYKEVKSGMYIENFNVSGSNVNFGNVYDSTFSIDNSFIEIEKSINENAKDEDKNELLEIMQDVKDYIDNISETKTIGKNTGLFKRIGKHIQTYQWFYQMIINLIGNAVVAVMNGI